MTTTDAYEAVAGDDSLFRHEALFYDGEDEFVGEASAFIRAGQAACEATLVVVSGRKIERLREALGRDADGVRFADMASVGHNPGRIIPAWHEFVDAHAAPGIGLRGIGEPVYPERHPDELVECQRHESLLNLAFADTRSFWLLCPYDRSALDADVLDEARRSHPVLGCRGSHHESESYAGLTRIAEPFTTPLSDPPRDAVPFAVVFDTLAAMRRFAGDESARLGLDPARRDDFVLAMSEIATNSIEHGRGVASLRIWRDDARVVAELRDAGSFEEPLAGRRRVSPDAARGRGLWMANQLCDLVQIRATPDGTVVRAHLALR